MSRIIDVSRNNGVIDWKKVAGSGVTDVIIRLSMGYNTMDKMATLNAKGAAAAGIAVSYYHFAYPDRKTGGTLVDDAVNEAKYFTGLFMSGTIPAPKWIAVDLENWEGQRDSPLVPNEYYQWLQVFLREVMTRSMKAPVIYSYGPYLNSRLPAGHTLGVFPLWIAHYTKAPAPTLPNGWDRYFLWQKDSKGVMSGIPTATDLNILYQG